MRRKFALWALLYSMIVLYCSTVVGPQGLHFVPMDWGLAWNKFLGTSFWINGSDQRADWMANLVMLVPMGYMLTGVLDTRRGIFLGLGSSLVAMVICVAFVLGVKFLQLFFPGRTVSLNYITAQSIGSVVGMVSYWHWHPKLLSFRRAMGTPAALSHLLEAYALAYLTFQLLPLNFTLSYSDLHQRLLVVRHILLGWPAAGRLMPIRVVLIAVDVLAAVPLGLLLGLRARRASIIALGLVSLIAMTAIVVAKVFLISGTPYLVSIVYRTMAILMGIGLSRLRRTDWIVSLRPGLRRNLPLLIPLYVLVVLGVNGLLRIHWRNTEDAETLFVDTRGLLPFWNWYIVSKAQAVESLVVHAIMFLPVGIMFSLRKTKQLGNTWLAGFVAFGFALLVEVGKWFAPGEFPDFYEAFTAAAAAALTVRVMPTMWQLFETPTGASSIPPETEIGAHDSHAPGAQRQRARYR